MIIKEILVSIVRNLAKASLVVMVGVTLSGCVVRPLGWGWWDGDGGRRGGGRHQSGYDQGRSQGGYGNQGYDNSRDGRRGW
jgi:hypothetical protein